MLYLLLFLLLLPIHCLAQHATIAATKMNVLYIGVNNPVSFAVENVKRSDLELVIQNGTAKRTGDCDYEISVTKPGTTFISLIKGQDTVYQAKYRVKLLPDPVADLPTGNAHWMPLDMLCLDSLRSRNGLNMVIDYFDF